MQDAHAWWGKVMFTNITTLWLWHGMRYGEVLLASHAILLCRLALIQAANFDASL